MSDIVLDNKAANYLNICSHLCYAVFYTEESKIRNYFQSESISNDNIKFINIFMSDDKSKVANTSIIDIEHPTKGKITALAVAFQGTIDLIDVQSDITSLSLKDFISTGYVNENISPEVIGKAGSGILDYYNTIKNKKPSTINVSPSSQGNISLFDKIIDEGNKYKHVIITGHSLGGAVAQLCAIDYFKSYAEKNNIEVHLITFGCPRTFDKTTAENIQSVMKFENFRVVNDRDPITEVPDPIRFGHIGSPIGFDPNLGKWIHVKVYSSIFRNRVRLSEFNGFSMCVNVNCHLLKGKTGYIKRIHNHIDNIYESQQCGCYIV